jgi:hypothetical protein
MSEEKIKPALSPFQWSSVKRDGEVWSVTPAAQMAGEAGSVPRVTRATAPLYIALANHALLDTDPRKITRGMVNALRDTASDHQWDVDLNTFLNAIADALDSYLPPEKRSSDEMP